MNNNTKKLVYTALIAACYAALTMVLAPISYGVLQFRISEVFCVLPFFFTPAAAGLTIGCIIANVMSAAGMLDIVFGSLATLLAGLCTAAIGTRARRALLAGNSDAVIKNGAEKKAASIGWGSCLAACAMPVLFNAPIVGAVLSYAFSENGFWQGFVIFGAQVGISEAVVMFALGLPLMRYLLKSSFLNSFIKNLL